MSVIAWAKTTVAFKVTFAYPIVNHFRAILFPKYLKKHKKGTLNRLKRLSNCFICVVTPSGFVQQIRILKSQSGFSQIRL